MHSKRRFFYALISALFLGSLACSAQVSLIDYAAGSLDGTLWQLNSYGPQGSEVAVAAEAQITMAFTSENKVGGTDGCNMFEGVYQAGFGELEFHDLQSSSSYCSNPALKGQDMQYLQALAQAGRYEIRGDQLIIWYGDE